MLPVLLTDSVTSDIDRSVHYTLLWGLEGVALRTVGGADDRVPFVNESKLRRRLEEHELPVAAVWPGMFEGAIADRAAWMNEVAAFDETLQFCRRIGCRRVVVSAFEGPETDREVAADALRRAGGAAARHGLVVAVHNEAGGAFATGDALAALLEAADHAAVRAAWEPAAAARAGADPGAGLEALAGRVELVHCTDGKEAGDGWEAAALGEGAVDWRRQAELLAAQGFDGPMVLEVTLDPRPKQGLRDATRLIGLVRDARRAAP